MPVKNRLVGAVGRACRQNFQIYEDTKMQTRYVGYNQMYKLSIGRFSD